MPDPYDVAVIGAGPGGYVAAIRAAQLGLKAAIIEKDAVGGTCLNWGCIPSKALLYSAELLNLYKRGPEFGITTGEVTANLGVSVDRSRDIVAKFVSGVEGLLQQNKVDLIRGAARLEAPGRVRIDPSGDVVRARNVIIATGGVPRALPNVTIDGDRVITSRGALELRDIPSSIVIVGGGPIGVEFGYLYRSYGAEVTIVELLPHLLPNEDEDVSRQLERSFTAMGITVLTGAAVESVRTASDSVTVTVTKDGASQDLRAEKVLIGVGFGANTEALGLAEAGVELNRGWIKIDDYCATSVPGVWAIGDVTGKLLLAHVASHQGVTAVEKIAGLDPQPLDYESIPRAVYCQPQVAGLGLTEAQAKERGHDVVIGRFPFRASGKAMAMGDTEGFIKLVVDRESRAVLGYNMIGHGVTELLGEATLGAVLETTPTELGYAVHAHPTLSEALKEAALATTGEAIHFFSPKRA
ncbi:MAG TPA: dihydrolipoyl dehydrogenase [Dehalococcoidia bacterium]|nr:dihydrolipoyl dehydrogenase [Dehalococcoidia bacterium]